MMNNTLTRIHQDPGRQPRVLHLAFVQRHTVRRTSRRVQWDIQIIPDQSPTRGLFVFPFPRQLSHALSEQHLHPQDFSQLRGKDGNISFLFLGGNFVLVRPFHDNLSFVCIYWCDHCRSNKIVLVKYMKLTIRLLVNDGMLQIYLRLTEIPTINQGFIVQFNIFSTNGLLGFLDRCIESAFRNTQVE